MKTDLPTDAPGIESAWTPPASWYVEESRYAAEAARIFSRSWQYAGPAAWLSAPGCYSSGTVCREPYCLVRGEDGRLRAFANLCRHRATTLLSGAGRTAQIVCPYHGWTYRLDGRLRSAPRMAGVQDFHPESFGLVPLAVEEWGPFAFVNGSAAAAPLAPELVALASRLAATGLERLEHVKRSSYTLACNWKVFVDNYLDGGYHVAHLHHGLAGQLELDSYLTEVFPRYAIQSCRGAAGAAGGASVDFQERIGGAALYAWIYPNFMINRYGPLMDVNHVLPLGPESCEVAFDYFLDRTAVADPEDFLAKSLAASHQVQLEDVAICEAVQNGLRSRNFDRGRYAPRVETAQFHFHRLLAADLRADA